ncbi:MAG TPA: hypothetical protein VFE62_23315 [Gemmataceae bacterium]|nr:hypothetical protein [Gemmataceae bacterium]
MQQYMRQGIIYAIVFLWFACSGILTRADDAEHPQSINPWQLASRATTSDTNANIRIYQPNLGALFDTAAELGPVESGITAREGESAQQRDDDIQKQLKDLTIKYQELRNSIKRNEAKLNNVDIQQEVRRARGFGRPKASRSQPMYHIGWFWWRDNSKEIDGRAPYHADMAPLEREIGPGVTFGDGVRWESEDQYFHLTFHNLTQLDLREPMQQGEPLHGGFVIPRQRWYFEGSVGDYADFVTSINRGYGSLDVLDSYVDFVVNREYLKFRVGRFKMPSQYEYWEFAEADLLGPERSLFVANYAANRQLGAMAHGYLFEKQLHYALAVGNGPRRSFEDFNGALDVFGYADYMPFVRDSDSPLQNLHIVGTYSYGDERNPPAPTSLQTLNQLSTGSASLTVSPTILQFGSNVFENGPRQFWGQELVYYYKSFGFLTSVQGGYQTYSNSPTGVGGLNGFASSSGQLLGATANSRVQVPIYGWSVGGWWFITGEEITRRRFLVEPREPFGFHSGGINPGAIELFGRVANLQTGNQVFSGGLVNAADWTNRATAIDVGVNWYLNHFVKFTLDYQHTFFADPVLLNDITGQRTRGIDMLMFRTQFYF